MGPNLTKLFEDVNHCTLDGDLACGTLQDLFDRHGKALIEALEKCSRSAHPVGCDTWEGGGCTCGKFEARQLLAQLESEAQR